jgi:hypothetical protein
MVAADGGVDPGAVLTIVSLLGLIAMLVGSAPVLREPAWASQGLAAAGAWLGTAGFAGSRWRGCSASWSWSSAPSRLAGPSRGRALPHRIRRGVAS